MSKELDAWQEIKLGYICGQGAVNEFALKEKERENFKIIETALKQQENDREIWENYLKEIKNLPPVEVQMKLKALEIISKKNVKIDFLKYQSDVVFYNMAVFEKEEKLTQEEFNLLKKVLP